MNYVPVNTVADAVALHSVNLSAFEGHEWDAIYDAISAAILAIDGVSCQPRCKTNGNRNTAGVYLQILSEVLMREKERIVARLEAERPCDAHSRSHRANLLVRYQAECGELSIPDLAAYALSLTSEQH